MTQRQILEFPDPRLQFTSAPVVDFDDSLQELVDDLLETMYSTSGIGLSAPQIDDRRRVLVMDLSGDASAPQVFINPEILRTAMPGIVEESCLSVPDTVVNVMRATRVQMRAEDRHGETAEYELDGMHAVCLQHEMDHLNGKLLIDRLPFLRRLRVRSELRKRLKRQQDELDGRNAA